jgi:uncharacterized 2Fe-2S/4Fe-4S cluster protein (DUF4445 family)
MPRTIPVTFFPSGATALVPPGTTIAAAAARAGIVLSTPCGTRGICGECGVRIVFGELEPADATERATLKRAAAGIRLACRARVAEPVGVRPLILHALSVRKFEPVPQGAQVVAGIDVGTTNVSALLVDANSGRYLATATVANRQSSFGADVLSRLNAAIEGAGPELQMLAEDSIAEAVAAACETADVTVDSVVRAAIAGNTAMASLLLGHDVTSLATAPFVPPFAAPTALSPIGAPAAAIPALGGAVVVPPVAGFVGGDALAAALAAGLVGVRDDAAGSGEASGACRLLVDVGTNAEIVLRSHGRLVVASAAAGPAFEGWGVSSGGRAGTGAVERVTVVQGATRLETASGEHPERFSGAGLVSALSALRTLEWVDADGRIESDHVPVGHLRVDEAGVTWVILGSEERSLELSQLDIRALQLAKAAVRTGIDAVLRAAGRFADDVCELLLAGAFGHALAGGDAAAIGMVPPQLASSTRSVGNAALTGAAMIAVAPEWLDRAMKDVATVEHVDLASDESFQRDLIAALRLAP